MDTITNYAASAQSSAASGAMSEICVAKQKPSSKQDPDRTWLEVPPTWDASSHPSICWIDVWAEKTCSEVDDFQRFRDGETVSCRAAYNENPTLFDQIRDYAETLKFSFSETKKAIRWMFNCTGRLPLKTCAAKTDETPVNSDSSVLLAR
jgi:hypothetical protein